MWGWRQRGLEMGYIRASAQCLCGSPPFPSPPPPSPLLGCSSSALRLQTKPHLQEEKGHLSLHLIFFKVLCTLLLPGDHPWCLVTRSEPHVRTSPLGRRSPGVSWMLRANHRDYHSLLSAKATNTAGHQVLPGLAGTGTQSPGDLASARRGPQTGSRKISPDEK